MGKAKRNKRPPSVKKGSKEEERIPKGSKEEERIQKTFVLAYSWLFTQSSIGVLVSEFEKLKLKIIEMRCMVVTPDFARIHLDNIGCDHKAFSESIPLPFASWVDCIAHGPVTAMIVEGVDAVKIVHDLSKTQRLPFQVVEKKKVYSSDSCELLKQEVNELWGVTVYTNVSKDQANSCGLTKQDVIELWRGTVYTSVSEDQARLDINLWFDSTDFKITVSKSTKVVFVLPGAEYGPLAQVKDVWKRDASYKIKQDFKANFFMEKMCVLLIKPLAFHENCVGEILDAIEASCFGLRGLKLVKMAEHFSKAWGTDSVNCGDVYGVAVVVHELKSSLKIVPGDSKDINHRNKRFEIGSNYLYKSKQGEGVLEAASDFFDHGFIVWALENQSLLRGCIFQASLVGLTSLLN